MQDWDRFLLFLSQTLSKDAVEKWVRPLKVVRFDARNLYLQAPDAFMLTWFEHHVRPQALKHFLNGSGKTIKIHIKTDQDESFERKDKRKKWGAPSFQEERGFDCAPDPLDPEATFSSWIPSEENTYALKLLSPLKAGAFNPLYLHGEKGGGKTHLLMALAQTFKSFGLSTHFVGTETFTRHLISAIRFGHMDLFRKAYRTIDALLIDDIHLIAERSATQEELFHTFNTLHSLGKQIVLASHLAPEHLKGVEPRLISRFEWGLVLKITPLPQERRSELLLARSRARNYPLSEEVIAFLTQSFTSVNSLLMALDALILRIEAKKTMGECTVDTATELLDDLLQKERQSRITESVIVHAVAAYFDLEKKDLLGKSQTKEHAYPRQIAMYLMRKELNMPFKKIGAFFTKDHSTVIASVNSIERRLKEKEQDASTSILEVHALLHRKH